MKKTLLALFLIVFLTGCSYKIVKNDESNKNVAQDDILQKKELCASYKGKIVQEIKEILPDGGLEEIFYSPSQQSCLYVLGDATIDLPNMKVYHHFILIDYFTNKTLVDDNNCKELFDSCLNEFNNQISQYRK